MANNMETKMRTAYKPIKAFHPGETLDEKLQEMQMPVTEFAAQTGVPAFVIESIIAGNMSITADMALAFEKVTLIPAHYWLNAQHSYDEYLVDQEAANYQIRLTESQKRLASLMVSAITHVPASTRNIAYA